MRIRVVGNCKRCGICCKVCPHLVKDNTCAIHTTINYPQGCAEFPRIIDFMREHVPDSCGFEIEIVMSDGTVMR